MNASTAILKALNHRLESHPGLKKAYGHVLADPASNLGKMISGASHVTVGQAKKIPLLIFARLNDSVVNDQDQAKLRQECANAIRNFLEFREITFERLNEFSDAYVALVEKEDEARRKEKKGSIIPGGYREPQPQEKINLESWGVEVSCAIRTLVSEISTLSTKYSVEADPGGGAVIHGLDVQSLHQISQSLDNCCYPARSQRRKRVVTTGTRNASKFVYTLSYWQREPFTDGKYTREYLHLIRDREVDVFRMFVCDTVTDELKKLCEALDRPKGGHGYLGMMKAIAIDKSEIRPDHLANLKSLWLVDGHYGTRSLPFFDQKGNDAATSADDGHVFWGREAADEQAFVESLWSAYAD